jgi:uncharacterized damage-inducible protein DinB
MKTLLHQFAAYNLWANGALAGPIQALDSAVQMQPVRSSFPSLHATLLHMWDAESIWWQRMKLQEQVVRPSENFTGDTGVVVKGLLEQSKQWADWVQGAHEHMLEHQFIYRSSKRETFKQPVYQVLLHLLNHSTYHRGQLVTMLRQLGVTTIPGTDFIAWSRSRGG